MFLWKSLGSLILLFSFHSFAADSPSIQVRGGSAQLILGGKIEERLKKIPKFYPLAKSDFDPQVTGLFDGGEAALPMAAIGDFNLDGLKDLVLLGRLNAGRGHQFVVALMFVSQLTERRDSRSIDYKAYTVYSEKLNPGAVAHPLQYKKYPVLGTRSDKAYLTGKRGGADVIQIETLYAPDENWYRFARNKVVKMRVPKRSKAQ
ncbi:MAG: hypothetical protein AAF203_03655 [Pseudomonadota bacterium]